jgi:hypothetical protein
MYIEDVFRSFLAPGINNVPINKSINLSNWLKNGSGFQIYQQVQTTEFQINVFDRNEFLLPISQDCNRFSCSSIESVIKIEDFRILPKSIAWVLIKQYYAAFYSAHFLLRALGLSLTQLDTEVINSIKKIADLYGTLNSVNIESGYYLIDYSDINRILKCKKVNINFDGGSHVALWKLFGNKLKDMSIEMLAKFSTVDVQSISNKLTDLIDNLSYVGSNNCSWLTRMRNDLNYKHLFGVWHPYTLQANQLNLIKDNLELWRSDIMKIELKNLVGKELVRFSNSCQFIIGLSFIICNDMIERCSSGKSYLHSGFKRLINVA